MTSIEWVVNKITEVWEDRPAEPVSLFAGMGRVIADNVVSRYALPPMDICTAEGYAINSMDVMQVPVTLTRIGKSKSGKLFTGKIGPGETVHVAAGTPLPEGCDTVVPLDKVERNNLMVTILDMPSQGENVSPAGIDIDEGDILLKKGDIITTRHIGLAAAMRVPWLPVRRMPRIGILVSASETATQNFTANSHLNLSYSIGIALSSFITARGGVAVNLEEALDISAPIGHIIGFKADLHEALQGVDMLVTAGGVNTPDDNLMWTSLSQEGAMLEKVPVAIGQGESIIMGFRDKTPILGFPGNLVSSLICASLFLGPVIDHMLGVGGHLGKKYAALSRNLDVVDKRNSYLYARLYSDADGKWIVTPVSAQDTLMISVLATADCLIVINQEKEMLKGELVEVIMLTSSIVTT